MLHAERQGEPDNWHWCARLKVNGDDKCQHTYRFVCLPSHRVRPSPAQQLVVIAITATRRTAWQIGDAGWKAVAVAPHDTGEHQLLVSALAVCSYGLESAQQTHQLTRWSCTSVTAAACHSSGTPALFQCCCVWRACCCGVKSAMCDPLCLQLLVRTWLFACLTGGWPVTWLTEDLAEIPTERLVRMAV